MQEFKNYKHLLLQYELLQSRLSIHEDEARKIIRSIYDDICQILSLALVELHLTQPNLSEETKKKTFYAQELISTSIKRLRDTKNLLNEEMSLNTLALGELLRADCTRHFPEATLKISLNKPERSDVELNMHLFFYLMFKEILFELSESRQRRVERIDAAVFNGILHTSFVYYGEPIDITGMRKDVLNRNIAERIEAMNGRLFFTTLDSQTNRITFNIPVIYKNETNKSSLS